MDVIIALALLIWLFTANRKYYATRKRRIAATATSTRATLHWTSSLGPVAFSDGSLVVGVNVVPGIYVAPGVPGRELTWALSRVINGQRQVVVNQVNEGPAMVVITGADMAFESLNSGGWHRLHGYESAFEGRP